MNKLKEMFVFSLFREGNSNQFIYHLEAFVVVINGNAKRTNHSISKENKSKRNNERKCDKVNTNTHTRTLCATLSTIVKTYLKRQHKSLHWMFNKLKLVKLKSLSHTQLN